MATRSKAFLLVLLLATVTCILVLQISLDGWLLNGGFSLHQLNHVDQKTEHAQISVSRDAIEATSIVKTTRLTTLEQQHRNVTSTTFATKTKSSASHLTSAKPVQNYSSVAQVKSTSKPSQQVEAKIRVRQLQVSRTGQQPLKENPKLLVDRQAKLEEILKRNDVTQMLSRAIKAIQAMPVVKPEKVIRIFLITYFRSGSSFVGELLQQNWKTFYQFEPLHYMSYNRRIPDDRLNEAFQLFSSIYHCNFTNLDNYFKWARRQRNQFLFARSLFLWFSCRTKPRMCFHSDFVSAVCQRAPVQVMKVTRLHMRQLKMFLEENSDLGIKVVFLSRDPRGIISSRWSLDWCNGTDCSDPNVLCSEMTDDLAVFEELQKAHPSNFIQVRYEDIAQHPNETASKLFNFLHLPFSPSVQRFLKSHTIARKADNLDPYSTRRNSSSMAFSWRQRFTFEQVKSVQATCSGVIQKLNYSLISSADELDHTTRSRVQPGASKSTSKPSANEKPSRNHYQNQYSLGSASGGAYNLTAVKMEILRSRQNTTNNYPKRLSHSSRPHLSMEKNLAGNPLLNGLGVNSTVKKISFNTNSNDAMR